MLKVEPIVKTLNTYLDDRGYLCEILRSDDPFYTKFGQTYISTIYPNTIKGFHIHDRKTDMISCIHGQVKLVLIESEENIWEFHLSPMVPKLVIIPPGLWHGWMCIGNEEAVLLNVTTEPFNKDDKDEFRVDPIQNPWSYKWEIKHG